MLISKVPFGTCECNCGQKVYKRQYRLSRGDLVTRQQRFVRGHQPRDRVKYWETRRQKAGMVEAEPIYRRLNRIREAKGLSWSHLARVMKFKRGCELSQLANQKWITPQMLEKIQAGIGRLQHLYVNPSTRPLPDRVDAFILWNVVLKAVNESGLSLKQIADKLGYSSTHSLTQVRVQEWVGGRKATHILSELAKLPSTARVITPRERRRLRMMKVA